MKKVKLGILGSSNSSQYFTNGLHQNGWSLAKMLSKEGSFDVSIISKNIKSKTIFGLKAESHCDESLFDKDIIICISYSLSSSESERLKKKGKKVILMHYGNSIMGDLFNYVEWNSGHDPKYPNLEFLRKSYSTAPDKVFYSPHFEFQEQYYALTSGVKTEDIAIAPYIWNSFFVDKSLSDSTKKGAMSFKAGDKKNKTLIFSEPSINPIKTNLIPILMANEVYEANKNAFEKAYALGSERILSHKNKSDFLAKIKLLSIGRSGKFSFEKRIPMTKILKDIGRVMVSHQVRNPLNYTYFEFAYFGFPFVHNSQLLSEYGYYYEDCNVLDGAKKVSEALSHEDLTEKERLIYKNRCDDMIWKHSPENKKNISKYVELVSSVL